MRVTSSPEVDATGGSPCPLECLLGATMSMYKCEFSLMYICYRVFAQRWCVVPRVASKGAIVNVYASLLSIVCSLSLHLNRLSQGPLV